MHAFLALLLLSHDLGFLLLAFVFIAFLIHEELVKVTALHGIGCDTTEFKTDNTWLAINYLLLAKHALLAVALSNARCWRHIGILLTFLSHELGSESAPL